MSKSYCFEFSGTKEMFLEQLNKYHNNDQKFFYFDDYIVKLTENEIHFGVARGGHSGGYWFVPTIIESDGKISFCGKIEYIDHYSKEKGMKDFLNKLEAFCLLIILFPIFVIIKIYLFFDWLIRKILKRSKPKEETVEDKLYNLMEKHLNCTRK